MEGEEGGTVEEGLITQEVEAGTRILNHLVRNPKAARTAETPRGTRGHTVERITLVPTRTKCFARCSEITRSSGTLSRSLQGVRLVIDRAMDFQGGSRGVRLGGPWVA